MEQLAPGIIRIHYPEIAIHEIVNVHLAPPHMARMTYNGAKGGRGGGVLYVVDMPRLGSNGSDKNRV